MLRLQTSAWVRRPSESAATVTVSHGVLQELNARGRLVESTLPACPWAGPLTWYLGEGKSLVYSRRVSAYILPAASRDAAWRASSRAITFRTRSDPATRTHHFAKLSLAQRVKVQKLFSTNTQCFRLVCFSRRVFENQFHPIMAWLGGQPLHCTYTAEHNPDKYYTYTMYIMYTMYILCIYYEPVYTTWYIPCIYVWHRKSIFLYSSLFVY